jgi:hypothetical protein
MEHRLLDNSVLDDDTGCWLWTGYVDRDGYGKMMRRVPGSGPRGFYAHRVSYETFIGPIPAGLEIDHACTTRACIHPNHLQSVTHQRNMALRIERYLATFEEEITI